MSGGKGRGKQSQDTASEDALVARPGATDPLLAAREGATDAQIAHALRQGLPHLTDPASLQDSKQPEGTGTTGKGKQPAAQKKRTRTTRQATQTQLLLPHEASYADATIAADGTTTGDALAAKAASEPPHEFDADALHAALGSIPPELWEIFLMNSTWAAGRTIMLRRTSKRVKEVVDKMRQTLVAKRD